MFSYFSLWGLGGFFGEMFHKRQNSLSRYFASEGKIALGDILPQETK